MELKVNQISVLDLFHIARSDFNILRLEIHISLYLEKYLSITITINRLWDQLPPKPKLFFYLFLHNSPHGYSISYYGNRMWTISNGNAANNSIFLFKFSLPWIYIKSKPNHILKGLILLSNYRYFFEEDMF